MGVKLLGRTEFTGLLAATSDDASFIYFLTECCGASAKGHMYGVVCRSCYTYIDPLLGDIYAEDFHGPILPPTATDEKVFAKGCTTTA